MYRFKDIQSYSRNHTPQTHIILKCYPLLPLIGFASSFQSIHEGMSYVNAYLAFDE